MENKEKTTIFKQTWWVKTIMKNLGFIYFIGFLGLVYIGNTHQAEKNVRKIDQKKKELHNSHIELMSIKTYLMKGTTKSELEKALKKDDVNFGNKSPKKIKVSKS